jgi:gamma-tubulin complex component 2
MHTCTMFATYTAWLSRELEKTDPDLIGSEKPANMSMKQWIKYQEERNQRHTNSNSSSNTSSSATSDAARLEKLSDTLQKYEYNFSRHLQILLDSLNHYAATETVVLLGLCARLSTANQGTQFSGLRNDDDNAAT